MNGWEPRSALTSASSTASALLVMVVVCALGCGRNPYAGTNSYWGAPYASQYPGAMMPGAPGAPAYGNPAQIAELERRIQQLDMDNRQLTTQLAQSQQKWQVSDERANLFQRQLQDATAQLQQARLAQQELQGQARGMQASMSARGGATLRPNTSGPQPTLPGLVGGTQAAPYPGQMPVQAPQTIPGTQPGQPLGQAYGPVTGSLAGGSAAGGFGSMVSASANAYQVPGASVQVEGQVVRIRVPADQLFTPGAGSLNPNAYLVLDNVANAIHKSFQRQRIAIEAHTDSGNLTGGAFSTPYQLATAQAQAVMDQLVRRNQVPMQQLTVVAHGANIPRADNQTPAGRAENRRIEFVVYPERF